MSVSPISSSSYYPIDTSFATTSAQTNMQQIQSEFQQLGSDLQSGNLTQAQQDYATLSQSLPSSGQNSSNPLMQDLNTVNQDLQSGNLAGAQQAFANLDSHLKHHHGHFSAGSSGSTGVSAQQDSAISQEFGALGQALQTGSLTAAQQAYSALQQGLQSLGLNSSSSSASTSAGSIASQVMGAVSLFA
jgi:hypothetical protein